MSLLLDSLLIENYRCFKELRIEKLGRVNLIVGKNNAGKTALLEALRIYASGGNPWLLVDILEERNEGRSERKETNLSDINYNDISDNIRFLFNGRYFPKENEQSLKIGSINLSNLFVSLSIIPFNFNKDNSNDNKLISDLKKRANVPDGVDITAKIIFISNGFVSKGVLYLDEIFKRDSVIRSTTQDNLNAINYVYLPVNGFIQEKNRIDLWDNIALTTSEDDVINILHIIMPTIKRLNYKGDYHKYDGLAPFARVDGIDEPLPLKSFGDGINRLFSIALALVNAKDGFLLIDEIDTGLYHRIQADVWKIIFRLSKQLNVQVFATTHSWDCVEAFNEAVEENEPDDAMLVRLENNDGVNRTVLYDKRRIGIAAHDQIEVR